MEIVPMPSVAPGIQSAKLFSYVHSPVIVHRSNNWKSVLIHSFTSHGAVFRLLDTDRLI